MAAGRDRADGGGSIMSCNTRIWWDTDGTDGVGWAYTVQHDASCGGGCDSDPLGPTVARNTAAARTEERKTLAQLVRRYQRATRRGTCVPIPVIERC